MSHEILHPLIGPWRDGELDPGTAAAVASHVSECAACRDEVAAMRRMSEAFRSLDRHAIPEDLRGRLRADVPGSSSRLSRRPWAVASLASAALMILLVTVGVIRTRGTQPVPLESPATMTQGPMPRDETRSIAFGDEDGGASATSSGPGERPAGEGAGGGADSGTPADLGMQAAPPAPGGETESGAASPPVSPPPVSRAGEAAGAGRARANSGDFDPLTYRGRVLPQADGTLRLEVTIARRTAGAAGSADAVGVHASPTTGDMPRKKGDAPAGDRTDAAEDPPAATVAPRVAARAAHERSQEADPTPSEESTAGGKASSSSAPSSAATPQSAESDPDRTPPPGPAPGSSLIVFLILVDESGRIVEADMLGARTLPVATIEKVRDELLGRMTPPPPPGRAFRTTIEVEVPPAPPTR